MEPIIPIAIVAIAILICILAGGIHKVEEGHVAVYFRGGKLLDGKAMLFLTQYKM